MNLETRLNASEAKEDKPSRARKKAKNSKRKSYFLRALLTDGSIKREQLLDMAAFEAERAAG